MKLTIGRTVIFHGVSSNGSYVHPAVITRVWSDTTVNLTVFFDNGIPTPYTSVVLDPEEKQQVGWRWPEIIKQEVTRQTNPK